MPRHRRTELTTLLPAVLCFAVAAAGQTSSVRKVQVLNNKNAVEIEIEASDRLVPQTRVLTGPDRLVVDFPNTTPGNSTRSQLVNRGPVKTVRVGLFHSNPPVTRVVVDLSSPQSYQIFPSGRTVIIKVTGAASTERASAQPNAAQQGPPQVDDFPPTRPGLVEANYIAATEPMRRALPAEPGLEVTFRDGMLSIRSNKATLSQVLFAVHQRTGADIAISAGAEQEKVVTDLGPGPAPEILATLLNGSNFNFLILSSPNDARALDRVILSPRAGGMVTHMAPIRSSNDDDAEADPPQNEAPPVRAKGPPGPPPQLPGSQPEVKAPGDDNTPD
jgi:AMIN domain